MPLNPKKIYICCISWVVDYKVSGLRDKALNPYYLISLYATLEPSFDHAIYGMTIINTICFA